MADFQPGDRVRIRTHLFDNLLPMLVVTEGSIGQVMSLDAYFAYLRSYLQPEEIDQERVKADLTRWNCYPVTIEQIAPVDTACLEDNMMVYLEHKVHLIGDSSLELVAANGPGE